MQALRMMTPWQLFLYVSYAAAVATNYTDAVHNLKDQLLQGYDKDVPPMDNATTPAVVQCRFLLNSVLNFDELSMELTTSSYILMTWNETRIRWQPSFDNGFTETLSIPVTSVWSPGLALMNPTDAVESMTRNWMTVRYQSDGKASVFGGGVFKSICSVDVTYYPFDTQACSLNFMEINYQDIEVKLVSVTDKIVYADFEENGVWMIDDTKSIVMNDLNGRAEYRNTLYLRRRPIFFVVNILLPVVFMALLNIFVFALPSESGERMSYSITVLLAIAVFLTLLGDNIPKTSSPMSFLSYFLLVYLSVSVFICIATIYNLRVFHTEESEQIPTWLKAVTGTINGWSCKQMRKSGACQVPDKRTKGVNDEKVGMDKGKNTDMVRPVSSLSPVRINSVSKNSVHALDHTDRKADNFDSSYKSSWVQALDTDLSVRPGEFGCDQGDIMEKPKEGKREKEDKKGEEEEESHVTWQDVSRMLDKVLAMASLLIIIVSAIAFSAIVSGNTT